MSITPESLVASFGLPGASSGQILPLAEEDWTALAARVRAERLEGLWVAAVASGSLPVSSRQMAEVRDAGRARARVDLELEREMLRVVAIFESEKIPYRVLKGPALAHGVYPDPMWRGFGDVDLLVGPDMWYRAVSVLEASGARRLTPEIRPDFDLHFGKDATLVSSQWEIDLHRRLVLGPYGFWAPTEEILSRPASELSIAGVNVSVLTLEDAFLNACYSAALADDPPRLIAMRDVAQIAFGEALDLDRLLETARRWSGTEVVARALSLAQRHLGVSLEATAVGSRFAGVSRSTRHRLLMASYRGAGRGYTSQLAGVVALRGVQPKISYLAALARPQKAYLSARGFTPAGFLRHAGRRIWSRG